MAVREARHAMESPDDLTLLQEIAQRRDQASYAVLFSRYEKRAYNLALHLTRNHDQAQDAVQEAMLDVWLHASAYRPGHAAGWILRIVANRSLAITNKHKKEGNQMHEREIASVAVPDSSPADRSEREELLGVLRECLQRLPHLDQQVLALCYAGGMTQEEAGAALSLSRRTISSRLANACTQLHTQLAQAGYVAALPLISVDGLSEAICSGCEAPPGFHERVLQHSAQHAGGPHQTAAAQSQRVALAKAGSSSAWIVMGLMGLAASAIVWCSFDGNAPQAADRPQGNTENKAHPTDGVGEGKGSGPQPPRGLAKVKRHWSFVDHPAQDLQVVEGSWRWIRKGAIGGMESAGSNHTFFLIPDKIPPLPLQLTLKQIKTIRNDAVVSAGCFWIKDMHTISYDMSPKKIHTLPGNAGRVFKIFLIGSYVIYCTEENEVIQLNRYATDYPSEQVGVMIQGLFLSVMELRTLEPHEIPASLRDPKKLQAKFDMKPARGP